MGNSPADPDQPSTGGHTAFHYSEVRRRIAANLGAEVRRAQDQGDSDLP